MTNYPNTRIQAPFGDIYTPNTSATDNLAKQIYAGEQQKAKDQALENKRLDDEFAKSVAGIRDVDISDLTKVYGDWKLANQQLIKQRHSANPQQQLDVLKKKADMYQLIQKSKDIKAKELEVRKMGDKPNPNLQDDWQEQLSNSMKTSIGQGNKFTDYNHVYNGNDYKDASKDMQSWLGKPLTGVVGKPINMDNKGLQTKSQVYSFPSNKTGDIVLRDALIGMTKDRKALHHWQYQSTRVPDDEYAKTNAEYQALPKDKWDLLGKPKPVLDISTITDPLVKYATHIAQTHELNNIPIPTGFKYETNDKNKIDYLQKNKEKNIVLNKSGQQVDIPYMTDDYFDKYGKQLTSSEQQAIQNIAGFIPTGYVEAKDIHPNDYNTITGRDLSKRIRGVEPLDIDGKQVFLVNKDGDWIGDGNAKISRDAVRNVNIEKRVNTKAKATNEANKKGFGNKNDNDPLKIHQ